METLIEFINNSKTPLQLNDLYQQYLQSGQTEITTSRSLLDRLIALGYLSYRTGNITFISQPLTQPLTQHQTHHQTQHQVEATKNEVTKKEVTKNEVTKKKKIEKEAVFEWREMMDMNRQLIESNRQLQHMNQGLLDSIRQKDEQINLLTNRIEGLTVEVKEGFSDLKKKLMVNFDNVNKIVEYHDLYLTSRKVAKVFSL